MCTDSCLPFHSVCLTGFSGIQAASSRRPPGSEERDSIHLSSLLPPPPSSSGSAPSSTDTAVPPASNTSTASVATSTAPPGTPAISTGSQKRPAHPLGAVVGFALLAVAELSELASQAKAQQRERQEQRKHRQRRRSSTESAGEQPPASTAAVADAVADVDDTDTVQRGSGAFELASLGWRPRSTDTASLVSSDATSSSEGAGSGSRAAHRHQRKRSSGFAASSPAVTAQQVVMRLRQFLRVTGIIPNNRSLRAAAAARNRRARSVAAPPPLPPAGADAGGGDGDLLGTPATAIPRATSVPQARVAAAGASAGLSVAVGGVPGSVPAATPLSSPQISLLASHLGLQVEDIPENTSLDAAHALAATFGGEASAVTAVLEGVVMCAVPDCARIVHKAGELCENVSGSRGGGWCLCAVLTSSCACAVGLAAWW